MRDTRVIISPEFKLRRVYKCEKCGVEVGLDKAKVPNLSRKLWHEDLHPWTEGRFPPFRKCGVCFEKYPKKSAPFMYPLPDNESGELMVVHKCKTKGCTFKAELPESLPDGWKCPKCRHGIIRRKRWE